MQTVILLNPVTHLTDASRGQMMGNVKSGDVYRVLIAAAIVTVIFAPIAMRMYCRER
jgi:ABC-2 type transport system permease protein